MAQLHEVQSKRKEYKKTKVVDKKPEVEEVVDHVSWLEWSEMYSMICGKDKDRVIIELPVDDKPEQTS